MTGIRRAVVLGGGLTGMLVSAMLARHVPEVTVVDRDVLPSGPLVRKGVPQARHAHILWSGGARIIESLLPGTTERLVAAGAHHIGIPHGQVSYTAFGWQHRFPASQFMIACSRALLDWTVRERVVGEPRLTVLDDTEVLEPVGDAARVTGVRVRPREGADTLLEADLVVDATGRGSPMKRWLTDLGVPAPEEEYVDSGMVYATRIFQAPEYAHSGFPLISVQADHREARPGCNAVLMPIEDGRWIVTISGTRGGEPPMDDAGFVEFARTGVRHPLVGDIISQVKPLTSIQRSRSTVNRRFHYDRLASWPEGLVVLGDAVAAFNPVYGHGMSAAAHSVLALEKVLTGPVAGGPGTARAAQRAISVAVDDAWVLATSNDVCYPGCDARTQDPRLTRHAGERQRAADMVGLIATRNAEVNRAAVALNTLSAPLTAMQAPPVLAALRRGAELPPVPEPPLSEQEISLLPPGVTAAG